MDRTQAPALEEPAAYEHVVGHLRDGMRAGVPVPDAADPKLETARVAVER